MTEKKIDVGDNFTFTPSDLTYIRLTRGHYSIMIDKFIEMDVFCVCVENDKRKTSSIQSTFRNTLVRRKIHNVKVSFREKKVYLYRTDKK